MSLIDKFDKNVILAEAGIIPQIQSSVDYRISTSHLNNILKQHLLLKKKKKCTGYVTMLPSGISSHPDPDGYQITRPADNSDRDKSARKRGQVGP